MTARPRVVHVYKDVYPFVEGGIERTIYHMARLTREEFEPMIVTASSTRHSSVRKIEGDIDVIEVASYGRLLSSPIAPGFVGALRRSKADLFHFHLPHPTGEVAFLLSRLKTPAVATYHSDIVRQRRAGALYGPVQRRFLRRMKIIMPTSQRYLETSKTLEPFADRCRVVPLGLPLEDYEQGEETRTQSELYRRQWGKFVLFIGVLRPYKGLTYLLSAMAELSDTHLVIAGEGKESEELKRQAARSGLTGRVHFLGRVDHPTAVALFGGASVFCLPAHQRSEAFGLCQIEAMACGLPVVSTDLPTGVPEVNRDGVTGLIVPPADAAALAGAIRRILAEKDFAKDLGAGGRKRAAQLYSAGRMADNIISVYRKAL